MRLEYFPDSDTLSVVLSSGPSPFGFDTEDADVIIRHDDNGRIGEVTIEHASRRVDLDELRESLNFVPNETEHLAPPAQPAYKSTEHRLQEIVEQIDLLTRRFEEILAENGLGEQYADMLGLESRKRKVRGFKSFLAETRGVKG